LGRGLSTGYNFSGKYYSIRLYNRALTPEEIKHNFEIDNARYNISPYDFEIEYLESDGNQYINTSLYPLNGVTGTIRILCGGVIDGYNPTGNSYKNACIVNCR